jgi:carboxymethylenebutenolidase
MGSMASCLNNNEATPERYNKAAADQAWQRTIAWFNKYVRG